MHALHNRISILTKTDIGKTAMSAALANDISLWVVLTVMISLGNNARKAPWALMSTVGFIVFSVIALACLSTLVVAFFHGMPLREGVALRVLMNTKGLLALIAINTRRPCGLPRIKNKILTWPNHMLRGDGRKVELEALEGTLPCSSLVARMTERRCVMLGRWRATRNITPTVVRFVESKNEVDLRLSDLTNEEIGEVSMETMEAQVEIRLDESFISEFRHYTDGDKWIMYFVKAVRNGAETIETIKSMFPGFDLFILGRGMGMSSRFTAGIDEWSEGPEIGAIGDLLMVSDFSSTIPILVVQQYAGARPAGEALTNPRPRGSHFEPFAKHRDMGDVY
ncbi:hypothetical protein Acr_00g0045940 [Actinidia rufa]|uniref:Cation/H+ exchanger domain-containing protein n=1 Tax=Actinidia rufa TaxID=165716 RepID=A0A7J0DJB0_9ERIC|nr:hypothetical protein Acr_00g0045940 [Actinidia rufa]